MDTAESTGTFHLLTERAETARPLCLRTQKIKELKAPGTVNIRLRAEAVNQKESGWTPQPSVVHLAGEGFFRETELKRFRDPRQHGDQGCHKRLKWEVKRSLPTEW